MSMDQTITLGSSILVVDDTHADLRMLTKILSEHEYKVRPVAESSLAMSSAQAEPPDLILLDINMPEVSGYEVCTKLKADERTRDIPVIFISASDEILNKINAFFVGGVDYITKPFQLEEVLARVETHLTLRNLQKNLQQKNTLLQREIAERQRVEESLKESEERYRRLVELSPETIMVHQDGQLVYVNAAAVHLLAAGSLEELMGKPIAEIIQPDAQEIGKKRTARPFQGGETAVLQEGKIVRLDGQEVEVEIVDAPITYQGKPAIQMFIRDITERKQAEKLLRTSEKRYRSIFKNATIGMFQATPGGRFIAVNPALARMLGYASARELAESVMNIAEQLFVEPRHWYEVTELIQVTQETASVETRCRYKNGGEIIVLLNIWAVLNEQGEFHYFEGFIEDITERKQTERVLQEQGILLRGVTKAMKRLLVGQEFESSITDTLEILGFVTEVDRISIFETHPHPETGEPLMSQRFTWAKDLVAVQTNLPNLQSLPYSKGFNRWHKILNSNEAIWGLVREFPPSERALLERQGIISILVAPISMRNRFWGFIRFDDCQNERQWTEEDKSILLAMAGGIGGAIARQ